MAGAQHVAERLGCSGAFGGTGRRPVPAKLAFALLGGVRAGLVRTLAEGGTIRGAVQALALGVFVTLGACEQSTAPAPEAVAPPSLIPRADLFGSPIRSHPRLSPRGDMIAYLAPRDGMLNLWVVPADSTGQARPLTDERDRGVSDFVWGPAGATLLYLRDEAGDGNTRLFDVDVASGDVKALSPPGVRAQMLGMSANEPGVVIASLNLRNQAWPDVYRIDLASGERTLLARNVDAPGAPGFFRFVVDRQNNVRLGLKPLEDGGVELFSRDLESEEWTSLFVIPFEDAMSTTPIDFETDGRSFLMYDSTGRDRAALVRVDIETGARTVLGESPRADVVDVWLDPQTNAPEAFAAEYLRRDWRALDPEAQADLDFLQSQLRGEPRVVSRSLNDSRWIVVEDGPGRARRSYLYNRGEGRARRLSLLFRHRPALDHAQLQPMIPYEIEARDGLTMVSYLTLPPASDSDNDSIPDSPKPLVIVPHDGPWSRDSYGFDAIHQWLANRGYAVLSVNFRGSVGFGKAFLNAGNREWGGRMQEDLLDAADWAVARGVADPAKVAIVGAGYGGYAALSALAFSQERFACGVSLSGYPSLLATLRAVPPYLAAGGGTYRLRVGDVTSAEGRRALLERSPISGASAIERPLLMGVGGRDPFATRAQSNAFARALRGARPDPARAFIYVVFPDEGHFLERPADRLAFFGIVEQFLGSCLGGRTEPVGVAFEGATMLAIDGAARIPGLAAFEPPPPPPPPSPPISPRGNPALVSPFPEDPPEELRRLTPLE